MRTKRSIPKHNAPRQDKQGDLNLTQAARMLGISTLPLRQAVQRGEAPAPTRCPTAPCSSNAKTSNSPPRCLVILMWLSKTRPKHLRPSCWTGYAWGNCWQRARIRHSPSALGHGRFRPCHWTDPHRARPSRNSGAPVSYAVPSRMPSGPSQLPSGRHLDCST